VNIDVIDVAISNFFYPTAGLTTATDPVYDEAGVFQYTKSASAVTTLNPSHAGGTITSCSITPELTHLTGLTFNMFTCAISGTPIKLHSVVTTFVITAGNAGNPSTTTSIKITVVDEPPRSISYSPKSFSYEAEHALDGGTFPTPVIVGGPITGWSISPTLPTGLSLDGTGKVTGQPTSVSASTTYTVTASNTGGSVSATIDLVVVAHAPTGLSYSSTGDASFSFTWNQNLGSIEPKLDPDATKAGGTVTYSIEPTLPTGFNFAANTGIITGTPTVLQYPAVVHTVKAKNSNPHADETNITISVIDKPVSDLSYPTSGFLYPYILQQYTNGYKFEERVSAGTAKLSPKHNGGAPTMCSISPDITALTGLTFNKNNCEISDAAGSKKMEALTDFTIT